MCAPHSSRPSDRCKGRFDPSTGISSDAPPTPRFARRTRRRTKTHTLPYSALPHALRKDPRLWGKDKAKLLAAALLEYARDKPSCWPSNARLAADLNCCSRTVQYALAELRDAGWIAVEQGPDGRVIHLLWCKEPPCNGLHTPPYNGLRPKKKKGGEERNVTNIPAPERNAPPPRMPQVPPRTPQELPPALPTVSTSQPARPLPDELKALPGAEPSRVRSIAWRLAGHFQDVASIGFFVMVLGLVAKGLAPVERLLAAFVVADRARGKARKPGAIFTSAWSGWVPPPKPSEINRPTYHQALATVPRPEPPTPEPVAVPMVDRVERDRTRAALAYWEGLTAEERKRIEAEALAHAEPTARADYEAETVPVVRRMKLSALRHAYLETLAVAR